MYRTFFSATLRSFPLRTLALGISVRFWLFNSCSFEDAKLGHEVDEGPQRTQRDFLGYFFLTLYNKLFTTIKKSGINISADSYGLIGVEKIALVFNTSNYGVNKVTYHAGIHIIKYDAGAGVNKV
jgi:hypothetical protein